MARRNVPHKSVYETLATLEGKFWVNINCPKWNCCHSVTFDAAELVDQFGPDYPVDRMLARCRCRACGTKGAKITLWSPRRPDGLDKVRAAHAVRESPSPANTGISISPG